VDYINGPWSEFMGSSLADFARRLEALCGPSLWAMGLNNYCGLGFHTYKSWYSQLKTQLLFFFEKKVIYSIICVLRN